MTEDHRAYLLVYWSRPRLSGQRWVDRTNDPELRISPMTLGICRPDIRRDVLPGDDLFFLAFDEGRESGDRYYLSAHFHVGERISHDDARGLFGPRPNVLLDYLPEAGSVETGVLEYGARDYRELRWAGWMRPRLGGIELGRRVALSVEDVTWESTRATYVHAYWDHHNRWKHCLEKGAAYLVADGSSKIFAPPLSYRALFERRPSDVRTLPNPGDLRARSGERRHNKRRLRGDSLRYLLNVAASARAKA